MAGTTQEAWWWPFDLYMYILHVAKIFKGFKYLAANPCSVW